MKNDNEKKLFNTDVSISDFMQNTWNKRAVVYRNALEVPSVTREDFLELLQDQDFESRLVYKDKEGARKLAHGPLEPKELKRLIEAPHAILGHNLNTIEPSFYAFEQAVDFIPKWQFDDVMGVYSTPEMSLGAHTDNYHVFIVQGEGKRRWEIQHDPDKAWRAGQDIKELKSFTPDASYELTKGDVIYIPPGVAHHGISLTESTSFSIGFKAFEMEDLLSRYFHEVYASEQTMLYHAPLKSNPGLSEIAPHFFDQLKGCAQKHFDSQEFLAWSLQELSVPKVLPYAPQEEAPTDFSNLALCRDAHLKYVTYPLVQGRHLVGINGKTFHMDSEQLKDLLELLNCSPFEGIKLSMRSAEILSPILEQLYLIGAIFIEPELDDEAFQ